MVRSKCIAILVLSAIGVWGCGDDGNGSGGSGGSGASGGSGGSGESPQQACNNESDLQATIGNVEDYAPTFWGCYDTADTDLESSVDACMQEALDVSENCADCFGAFAACIDSGCGDVCNDRGVDTLPCQECVFDECNMDFNLCSGIAAPAAVPQ